MKKQNKIAEIIEKEFDSRLEYAVLADILERGITATKNISDDDIAKIEGNAMMTAEFMQAMIRTEKIICTECENTDIMGYIANMSIHEVAPKSEISLYKEDFRKDAWEEIEEKLYNQIDFESGVDYIRVNATVLDFHECESEEEDED